MPQNMILTLSMLRCPPDVAPQTREVAGGEFSLGRGPENDWVLPDPDRHLSKRHCLFAWRAGGWQITDLSTNGSFLNGETTPLGPERPRPLREGDRLVLGAYEIEIRLRPEAVTAGNAGVVDDLLDGLEAPGSGALLADDPWDEAAPSWAAPAAAPTQPDHTPAIEDAFRPPQPALPDDWDLDLPLTPATAAPAPPLASPSPALPSPALPGAAAPSNEAALLAGFLRGAGLPDAAPADPGALLEELGRAFRVLVGGLRRTLMARAAIKGEFRIEQTMIRSGGNNPLKFSADDDDALAALLGAGRRVDMTAAAAIADALRDIRLHELASMAAMQAAVRALLGEFDPAALKRAAEQGGLALLPAQRRARAFDAFEALHARISAALADDFDSVFGKSFARAYEAALRDAAASEPKETP